MAGLLTLVFPQWQGSGNRKDTYYGAMYLRDNILAGTEYEEVPVSLEIAPPEHGINGYSQILGNLESASKVLRRNNREKVFLAGGDCGTELAPISYLNSLYRGDLAVVWFDAHGDLNSPATSVTHNFHGMPLRCLLGDGDEKLKSGCFSLLRPEQVIMAGTRELDPPERAYIEENGICRITVDDLKNDPGIIARRVKEKGYRHVYAHIDLDVLYPEKYPWVQCPCENGLEAQELMAALRSLKDRHNIAGISVLELRPVEHMDPGPLRELVCFCTGI